MSVAECWHCHRPIGGGDYPVHTAGGYRHKSRCDPADSGRPYGLAAHRPGTPCHELCAGLTVVGRATEGTS